MTRRKAEYACSVSKSPMCWLMKTCSPTESATAFLRCAPTARIIVGGRSSDVRLWGLAEFAPPIESAAAHNPAPGAKPIRGPASRAQWNRPRAGQWDDYEREKHRRCRRAVPRLRVHRCKSVRHSSCRSWRRRENRVRPSANDATACKEASHQDRDCREPQVKKFRICEFVNFEICFSRTIGDSGERSNRSSSGETSHTALMLSSDGNIEREWFFFAMFALAQKANRIVVARIRH